MKIIGGKIYALRIPFVEAFSHSAKNRKFSDSIVVRLAADDGTTGYGEGAARPYVTGETVGTCVEYIKNQLYPSIAAHDFAEIHPHPNPLESFASISEVLVQESSGEVVWNAARSAVELALVDCFLKRQKLSLAEILPPKCQNVVYSGVITAGTIEKTVQNAKRFKLFGITQLKLKIGENGGDVFRVAAVREALGDAVSLRVDANGAYSVGQAIEVSSQLAPFKIDAIEQPIPRGNPKDLAYLASNSAIPVMADESLVTFKDANELIEASACQFFNLRLSKCGGLAQTLEIAQVARRAGIRLQLGCQVGETAVLSAAGRHIAAHLAGVEFVEGSFGNLLLTEDVSRNSINFGHGGRAPLLRGVGLGVEVREQILEKYAHSITIPGKE